MYGIAAWPFSSGPVGEPTQLRKSHTQLKYLTRQSERLSLSYPMRVFSFSFFSAIRPPSERSIRPHIDSETSEELQEPGSLPHGEALKLLCFFVGAVFMPLNSFLKGMRAAIVEKRIAIPKPWPYSP